MPDFRAFMPGGLPVPEDSAQLSPKPIPGTENLSMRRQRRPTQRKHSGLAGPAASHQPVGPRLVYTAFPAGSRPLPSPIAAPICRGCQHCGRTTVLPRGACRKGGLSRNHMRTSPSAEPKNSLAPLARGATLPGGTSRNEPSGSLRTHFSPDRFFKPKGESVISPSGFSKS